MLSIVFSSPSSVLSRTMGPRSSFEPSTASPFRAARMGEIDPESNTRLQAAFLRLLIARLSERSMSAFV